MDERRMALGHLLVKRGIVTPEQVDEALEIQKETNEKLGTILVELNYTTEEQIARALATKTGFEYMSLNSVGVNPEAAALISTETAMKYRAVPVAIQNDTLFVAMENPNDVVAMDDLSLITGMHNTRSCIGCWRLSPTQQLVSLTPLEEEEEEEELQEDDRIVGVSESVEPPAVQTVNQILGTAMRMNTSDIHIESQERSMRVRYRIDGVLHEMMTQPMHALRNRFPDQGYGRYGHFGEADPTGR